MNEISNFLKEPEVIATSVVIISGFIAWVVKGAVERPFIMASAAFEQFAQRRIEILGEFILIASRILYFIEQKNELKDVKEELQKALAKQGYAGHLSYEHLQKLIRISIDQETDVNLLKKTIEEIKNEYDSMVNHIRDKIKFHIKYDHCGFLKRTKSVIYYAFSLTLFSSLFVAFIFLVIFFINKYLFINETVTF